MRWAALAGSSLLLFLAAAKAHGRELRLERVAAGFDHVVFGGQNPAGVEAIWRAERLRFWILAPALAVVLVAALKARGAGNGVAAIGALTWAPAVVFAGLGVASIVRAGGARDALAGSIGWWAVVAAVGAATALAARGLTPAR